MEPLRAVYMVVQQLHSLQGLQQQNNTEFIDLQYRISKEDSMSREEKLEYIKERLQEIDDYILDEIYWALELEG